MGTEENKYAERVARIKTAIALGGGYIFDFDGSLENATEENLDAMFETLEKYGSY